MVKSPLNIFTIQSDKVELLKRFLSSAGSSLESFRYFKNRPLSILKNHIVTCILIEGDEPIGYGHLDKEDNKIWLGIAVSANFRGKGVGTMIMNFLILKANEEKLGLLHLTVDVDNIPALNLYKRFGFVYVKDIGERSILMECKL